MVSTRQLALVAIVVVLITMAAGTILYFDYDNDSSNGHQFAPADVALPVVGTEFHYALSDPTSAALSYSVYADVWSDNSANGRLRIDVLDDPGQYSDDNDAVVISTIYDFASASKYQVTTRNPGGHVLVQCTRTDLTTTQVDGIATNDNTRIKFQGCYAGDKCLWFVWDGESDWTTGGPVYSNEKYETEKSTGVITRMRKRVHTGAHPDGYDQADRDYFYCQNDCDVDPSKPICQGLTLSSFCAPSCSSWPPADEEEWCGMINHWFNVDHTETSGFDWYSTPLFQTPVTNAGADICVTIPAACDVNEAAFDEAAECPNVPIHVAGDADDQVKALPVSHDINVAGAGFFQKLATPSYPAPQDLAFKTESRNFEEEAWQCDLVWFVSSTLANACNSYMASGGKYGNWCGKGGGEDDLCNGANSCNTFDNCCYKHDNQWDEYGNRHGHSEDVGGILTILQCPVDKAFKQCRTPSNVCANTPTGDCWGNHAGCDSWGNCINSRNAANTLFDILPCSYKQRHWYATHWHWSWKWGNY